MCTKTAEVIISTSSYRLLQHVEEIASRAQRRELIALVKLDYLAGGVQSVACVSTAGGVCPRCATGAGARAGTAVRGGFSGHGGGDAGRLVAERVRDVVVVVCGDLLHSNCM